MTTQSIIEEKLNASFKPSHCEIINESHGHNVAKGAETHFKVVLVSSNFEAIRPVARHQQVYSVLQEELRGGVHALSLHTFTPQEWQQETQVADSPPCMGGSKK